jgi:hypothetical protein
MKLAKAGAAAMHVTGVDGNGIAKEIAAERACSRR